MDKSVEILIVYEDQHWAAIFRHMDKIFQKNAPHIEPHFDIIQNESLVLDNPTFFLNYDLIVLWDRGQVIYLPFTSSFFQSSICLMVPGSFL